MLEHFDRLTAARKKFEADLLAKVEEEILAKLKSQHLNGEQVAELGEPTLREMAHTLAMLGTIECQGIRTVRGEVHLDLLWHPSIPAELN